LVIVSRERAVEHVPLMKGFVGVAEIIIDRRVVERRRPGGAWPESQCRRRGERRSGPGEAGSRSLIFVA
jgi:hypothetical protein